MTARCSADSCAIASAISNRSSAAFTSSGVDCSGAPVFVDRTDDVAVPRAAPVVDDHVASHGEQPRPRRPLGVADDLRMLPRPQQRLLDDVLGVAGVCRSTSKRIAPQDRGVLVVERLHQRCFGSRVLAKRATRSPPPTDTSRQAFSSPPRNLTRAGRRRRCRFKA